MGSNSAGILGRTKQCLDRQGVRATVLKAVCLVVDYVFDLRRGTDTCTWVPLGGLTIQGANKDRGTEYQPTRVMPLRKLFRTLRPMIPPDSVLVDLGCGKGRVLLVASELGFKKVRGVEFAHELIEIARKNCSAQRAATKLDTEYEIVESDVVQYAIREDENIFFMANPFDEMVMRQVLRNITASVQASHRQVFIIYNNPVCSRTIEQDRDYAKLQEYRYCGHRFAVYSNRL